MCGIIGFIGDQPCADILLKGLSKLEYRGYDSAGIALLENNKIECFKEKGRLSNLCEEIETKSNLTATLGIGHTRWATHGKPSKINSHPHLSNNEKFAVVHNGIIENYSSLRADLMAKGYRFLSETDTEVVSVLLEDNDNGNILETIKKTVDMLSGSYALGIISSDDNNTLYCVRHSSPLIVGLSDNKQFIASDITPLLSYTRTIMQLSDGEIGVLKKSEVTIYDENLCEVKKETTNITWNVETAEKGGYEHFMLKEIFEQPKAIRDTIESRIKNNEIVFDELLLSDDDIKSINKIFIVACGSAYHVGMIGKYYLEDITRISTEADVASEFRYRNPIIDENTLCIIISQSGETADTLAALRLCNEKNAKTVSLVNVVGSTIANESQSVLYTWAGPEISVATTKAYSTQLALLYELGLFIADKRNCISKEKYKMCIEEIRSIPDKISDILNSSHEIKHLAERYAYLDHAYFIGRNLDYALAMEGSLKLKEISYIHSESYPAGELKHGTISLIEEKTFVVGILCCDDLIEKTMSNIKEVRARGAEVLSLTTEEHAAFVSTESDNVLTVPKIYKSFMPSLEVVPMQLLGYYIAKARHCDIDKPRNLAKSVTVE
ncbi:MAG: glutamine--fructose-6-phosphate transaminase (isomerizing) [Oscillospiraceae bacterium]